MARPGTINIFRLTSVIFFLIQNPTIFHYSVKNFLKKPHQPAIVSQSLEHPSYRRPYCASATGRQQQGIYQGVSIARRRRATSASHQLPETTNPERKIRSSPRSHCVSILLLIIYLFYCWCSCDVHFRHCSCAAAVLPANCCCCCLSAVRRVPPVLQRPTVLYSIGVVTVESDQLFECFGREFGENLDFYTHSLKWP